MDLDDLTQVAALAAEEGARTALSWQRRTSALMVRQKTGPRDLVSEADLATERVIRRTIRLQRPHDTVHGEEGGMVDGDSGITWVVDPIDGTTSYLYGRADWAVSVAAIDAEGTILGAAVAEPGYDRITTATRGGGTRLGGRPIAIAAGGQLAETLVEVNFGRPDQHPVAGRMVDALLARVRDLRRGGSAASALAHLAAGRADAVWSPGLQPWDGTAGILLVLEAGGVVGDLQGPSDGRWPASGDVLAAPEVLWEPLRDLLAEAVGPPG